MMSMENFLITSLLFVFLGLMIFLLNYICKKIKKSLGNRNLDGILYGKYDNVYMKTYDCEMERRRRF